MQKGVFKSRSLTIFDKILTSKYSLCKLIPSSWFHYFYCSVTFSLGQKKTMNTSQHTWVEIVGLMKFLWTLNYFWNNDKLLIKNFIWIGHCVFSKTKWSRKNLIYYSYLISHFTEMRLSWPKSKLHRLYQLRCMIFI